MQAIRLKRSQPRPRGRRWMMSVLITAATSYIYIPNRRTLRRPKCSVSMPSPKRAAARAG